MANDNNTTTKFKVDISELKKEFTEARRQIQLANSEFKAATGGMDDWTKSADGLSAKLKQLKDVLSAQKTQLESLEKQYALVVKEQGADSKGAEDLMIKINNQKAAIGNTEKQIQTYTSELSNLGAENEKVEELTEKLSDVSSAFGDVIGGFVTSMIAAAISKLKDLALESINVGKAFDTSMSQVQAISGATEDEYDQLREKAKEMGSQTKFTASQAADAFSYMAMAGWDAEEMISGVDGVMSLAAASGSDLARTSDIVTDALTAMGYSAEDAGKLADVMAAASANANTNVEMMGETFKQFAPVAGALGYSMEDVAIATGLMANSGIKASTAGTTLRSAFSRLVDPTEEMVDLMGDLGLVTKETINEIDGKKLEKAQTKVANKTADLEKAQLAYNSAVKKYSENAPQIGIALNNVEKAQVKVNAAIEKYGEDSPQVQTAIENLQNAQLKLTEAQTKYSSKSPEIEKAALNLQKAQNNLTQAQKELTREQEGSIKTVVTSSNALTDEKGNMRSMGEVIDILRDKLGDLDADQQAQAATILFGQKAMSGMLAIINSSDDDFEKLTKAISNSEGAAQSMADTMLDNLGGDMTLLQSKVESVQLAFYEKLAPALREGVEILSQFIDTFADELGAAVEDFVNEALPKILEGLHWIIENLPTIEALIVGVGTAWATWQVVGLITAITTALEGMTAAEVLLAAKQWLLNTAMAANPIGAIITLIAGLVAAFVVLWNKSDAFRQFWYDFGDSILEVWEDVVDGVTQWIDDLVWAWENAIKSIKDWFSDIVAFWGDVGKKLKNGAKDVWESVKDTFGAVADYFGNIFGKAWQKVKDVFSTGGKIFDGIKDGIVESFKEIVNGIIRAINKIVAIPFNAINKILDKIHDIEIAGVMPFEWVNTFDVPKIPELARGGVLKRGQLGLLEGNGSEAVVPLEKNTGWLDEIANRLYTKMSTQGGGVGAPAQNVTNNFYQTNNSPKALSRLEIYRQSKNLLRMKG